MATPTALLNEFTAFQSDMERRVAQELAQLYGAVVSPDLSVAARRALLLELLPGLVEEYGSVAASFGMWMFEEMTGEVPTVLVPSAAPAVAGSISALAGKPNALQRLISSMGRHVLGQARGAIHHNVGAHANMAYARVPNYAGQRHGKGPCEFCVVLASRGPVYATTATAGARGTGNEYHDECYCVPMAMPAANADHPRGRPEDWPRGYNPDKIYDEIYSPSHEYMDRIQDVTRKIREKDSTFR